MSADVRPMSGFQLTLMCLLDVRPMSGIQLTLMCLLDVRPMSGSIAVWDLCINFY